MGEVFYDGMVLDWMLLFFKQLTTNQYMDQQELYQQNWCSIVGGVLDWMLFFFKCPTTSQYMDDGQHYPKNNTNQKWHSIVRGLDGVVLLFVVSVLLCCCNVLFTKMYQNGMWEQ